MKIVTTTSFRAARVAFIATALLVAGCTERQITEPDQPPEPPPQMSVTEIRCTAAVATGRVSCVPAGPTAAGIVKMAPRFSLSASQAPEVPSITLGGQGTYVQLTNSGTSYDSGTDIFQTTVTVQNLIPQPLGTLDGTTIATEGIRVFFANGPVTTGGSGTVTVANPDGTDTFTGSGQPYFEYEELLEQNDISAGKLWQWNVPDGVTEFTFGVYVWAPVQYPDGYVTVTPATAQLDLGDADALTVDLAAQVFTAVGNLVAPQPTIAWSSSADGIATVDADGVVTAVKSGAVTITADAGDLDGTAAITVIQPASLTNSTVTASPTSLIADGTSESTITVTLRDARNNPLTESGGTVAMTLSAGTGTLGGVTDVGDGTYTAVLTAPSATGSGTVTATLDGDDLTDDAVVTYVAGDPASYEVLSSDDTPAPASTVTLTAQVKDANGNNVPGVRTVTWSSTNGGTFVGGNTSDTDANGLATKDFTVSADGGVVHVVTAATDAVDGDVTLTLTNAAPVPTDKAYDAFGNVPLDGTGLLVGATDADHASNTLTTVAETVASTQGGSATIATDGTFTYTSAIGFTGTDEFTFRVVDPAGAEGSATATITVGDVFWYVDGAFGGTSTGAADTPFKTVADGVTAATTGETVLVRNGSYTGAVTMGNGVILRGQSAAAVTRTLNGETVTLLDAGTAPTLSSGITVGQNNSITSFALTPTNANAITGTGFGTLTLDGISFNVTTGAALSLTTGTLTASNIGSMAASGGTHALLLNGVAGALTTTGGALSGGTTATVSIIGGTVDLTHPGNITQASNAPLLNVSGGHAGDLVLNGALNATNGTGLQFDNADGTYAFAGAVTLNGTDVGIDVLNGSAGAITFSGTTKSITNTGSGAGVAVAASTSALSFTNGGLAISTGAGAGFSANGGPTIVVTGSNNTIASTTGTALSLDGAVGGTGGLVFRSIAANGAANGVLLSNVTGTGLTVTGDGVNAGSGGTIQNTTAAAVSLSTAPSTSLAFMNLSGGVGGISGSAFNTLTVNGVSVASGAGAALNLSTGTLNGSFTSLGSTGGSNGVSLTSVGGSFTAAAGTLTGASAATFNVSGGSVSATFSGSISQANNAALVSVTGGHNGTLTFNTGTVGATLGTGLQFSNADGTYNFNGTTTLNGGDAGVDILSGSDGAFNFGSGTTITHNGTTTNQAFFHSASAADVTFNGSITKSAGTGWLVDVFDQDPASAITFQTGTLTANNNGQGILLNDADGTVSFNGTTNLTGSARARIGGGSIGTITFGTGTTVTNPTGANIFGLDVDNGGSATSVAFNGTITSNSGRPVRVTGMSSGSVVVSGNVTSTGEGILVSSNTGGAVTFSGASKSLNTGANAAVTLTSNSNTALNFTNGGLAISTTSGNGLVATGTGPGATTGGTLTVGTGANPNTIATGAGTALSLTNTTSGGMTFRSISAGVGAASGSLGIVMDNAGTGGLTVTGNSAGNCGGLANPSPAAAAPYGTATAANSADCTGGTIQARTGADGALAGMGLFMRNTSNISITRMQFSGTHDNYAIRGYNVSNLTLSNVLVDGTFGSNSSVLNDFNTGGVNTPEWAVRLENLTGSASVTNSTFRGGHSNEFGVLNSNGGSLNRLTLDQVTFPTQTRSTAGAGILAHSQQGNTGGTFNVTVQNSRFSGQRGSAIFLVAAANATSDFVVNNNVVYNQLAYEAAAVNQISGNTAINIAKGAFIGDNSTMTYAITNNRVRGQKGAAISAQTTTGTGTATGSITGNRVGESSVAESGAREATALFLNVGDFVKHKVLVENNTLTQYNGEAGMHVLAGGTALSAGPRTGSLHATIRNNSLSNVGVHGETWTSGLSFRMGTNSGNGGDRYTMCLNVTGNSLPASSYKDGKGAFAGIPGEPFDFEANNTGIPAANLWYKMTNYGVFQDTPANATRIQNAIGPANGGVVSGYIEVPQASSTYNTNNGVGIVCDLFP